MHLLVDMDDTIVEWGKAKDTGLRERWPHLKDFTFGDLQVGWDMNEGLNAEHRGALAELMDSPHFYYFMDPVPGAREALVQMEAAGHDVSIVSTPWLTNRTCMQDKYDWLEAEMGVGWGSKLILTRDKTAVRGDILFDDKPEIKGRYRPSWTQVVVDRPHNRYVTDAIRIPSIVDWVAGIAMVDLGLGVFA
jgi:5'-nucleotidase